MKQQMSEIKESLRKSRFDYVRKHPEQQDAIFRVPLKLGQVDDVILFFDDYDYLFRALESISKQIELIYPELDTLTQHGERLYKQGETFGAVADGKSILAAVERIEEIIGKKTDIDTEDTTD